jgi:hypothetical protein
VSSNHQEKEDKKMCVKCERKAKRIGIPKRKFGKIKYLAHQMLSGNAIPFFNDKRLNVAIEAHISRISKAKTKR